MDIQEKSNGKPAGLSNQYVTVLVTTGEPDLSQVEESLGVKVLARGCSNALLDKPDWIPSFTVQDGNPLIKNASWKRGNLREDQRERKSVVVDSVQTKHCIKRGESFIPVRYYFEVEMARAPEDRFGMIKNNPRAGKTSKSAVVTKNATVEEVFE